MSKKTTGIWDVIIVGAGASGMMAAIIAARRGKSVLLLERMERPGKKLLATGNGKCNFTNEYMETQCYHGDLRLAEQVLSAFSKEQVLTFFREIGIFPKNKRGYYYPNSQQAASVVDALIQELARCKVTLVTQAQLCAIVPEKYGYVCRTPDTSYRGKNVIVATGLFAAPKLGSDGSIIPILKELGHRFVPILPALCGFYAEGMQFRKVSGVRCDARLTLVVDGEPVANESGELQLADYGVSGIVVFQLSALAVRALYAKKTVQLHLNLLPDMTMEEVHAELCKRAERWKSDGDVTQLLRGLLNQKLISELLAKCGMKESFPLAQLKDSDITKLCEVLRDFPLTLKKVREAEYAQVCTGGIRSEEICYDTLESQLYPGLFFAGELLNVDGICGGYNLQWAWSSGYVAGSSIA